MAASVDPTPAPAKPKLVRRRSATGMFLQRYEEVGVPTLILAVAELAGDGLGVAALTQLADERFLRRFPRFRGYPTARHWVIPDAVDAARYVSDVALDGGDHRAGVVALLAAEARRPLPAQCTWEMLRVTCAGRVSLVMRISHTVLDGMVGSQILTHVLADGPAASGASPPASASSAEAATAGGAGASAARPRRSGARAGCLERAWAIARETLGLVFQVTCRRERRTALRLGPAAWKRRRRRPAADGAEPAAAVGISRPVAVADVKAVAKRHGATINDVVMAALGAGLHAHLAANAAAAGAAGDAADAAGAADAAALGRLRRLSLTGVMFVNPRKAHSFVMSAERASKLLDEYASMRTPGCDITFAFVRLPCGALEPEARLARVCSSTRRLKLAPVLPVLLRSVLSALIRHFGAKVGIAVGERLLLNKATFCFSNVPGPTAPATIGGVKVERF